MTKIATIARDSINSPNMSENDAAILKSVARELEAIGVEIVNCNEKPDAICHMSRNRATLEWLAKAEKRGTRIFNRSAAVRMCSRSAFTHALQRSGIQQPPYCIITEVGQLKSLDYPAWIKRGDGWSCDKDDVCYAANAGEAIEAALSMKERGIKEIIHSAHIIGDIIKFYGVGENYVRYCYPDTGKSKFGLEKINGIPHGYLFDKETMNREIIRAAKAVGLEIFGGDCIVTAKGEIYIIDLNDFPSFSAIREEAAREIATYITRTIKEETEYERRG